MRPNFCDLIVVNNYVSSGFVGNFIFVSLNHWPTVIIACMYTCSSILQYIATVYITRRIFGIETASRV